MAKCTKNRDLPPGVVSSVDDLATALGYHRRTLQEFKSREGFPIRATDGNYEILAVWKWKQDNWKADEVTEAELMDMENRTHDLIDSLREMQPELIHSLPESAQDAFSELLRDTIGKAIQSAFAGPLETSFYTEGYLISDSQKGGE